MQLWSKYYILGTGTLRAHNSRQEKEKMNRTIQYEIGAEEEGLTIKQFLKRRRYSGQNLVHLKKYEQGILLNNRPVYVIQPLKAGDFLTVNILEDRVSEKIPPVPLPLHIVYEDEDLMILDKEADMPIHPSLNNYENSLANGLAWYFSAQDIPFVFRCVNRLDRDTTGLTIIAKHLVSGGILSSMAARREIKREYLAIVSGTGLPSCGTINVPLGRDPDSAIRRMADFRNGEPSVTHYRVLEEANGCSLLSLHLETGRTHQIRVHMKYIGYPIIGDFLYNPDTTLIRRQALHSCRLEFSHPITGKPLDFSSPLPEDMKQALNCYLGREI